MRRVRCAGRWAVPLGHGALPVIGGAGMFGPETNGMWQSRILIADKATCFVASIAIWRAKSGSWKAAMTDYIELHARSAFSFLEGASTPEELIGACSELEMPAMALLDRDGVYGASRFHLAAKKIRIKAHIGAEVSVQRPTSEDQRPKEIVSIPLLVRNRTGYQNLCRLITLMKMRVPKHAKPGECTVTPNELAEHAEGLVCLTGGGDGLLAKDFHHRGHRGAQRNAEWLIDVFGKGNVYAELQRHFIRDEEARNHAVIKVARSLKPLVLAANGVCDPTLRHR